MDFVNYIDFLGKIFNCYNIMICMVMGIISYFLIEFEVFFIVGIFVLFFKC